MPWDIHLLRMRCHDRNKNIPILPMCRIVLTCIVCTVYKAGIFLPATQTLHFLYAASVIYLSYLLNIKGTYLEYFPGSYNIPTLIYEPIMKDYLYCKLLTRIFCGL